MTNASKHTLTAVNNQQLLAQVERIQAEIGSLDLGWGTDHTAHHANRWWVVDRGVIGQTDMSFSEIVAAMQSRIDSRLHSGELEQ